MTRRRLWILPLILFSFLLSLTAAAPAADPWASVDELVGKQQYQAALDATQKILAKAQAEKDETTWTKALIRKTLLEQGLHAAETAVKDFRTAKWPPGERSQALLRLFYANTLWNYHQTYAYEIGQREKVVSAREIDLKKWDSSTIQQEISRTYFEVYQKREALSGIALKDFPEFIVRNGYPEGVRSSFRDFVTYQWVEFLANTTTWSPRESQETYLLDLKALLTPGAKADAKSVPLLSEEVHPLVKVAALLSDLYLWHGAQHRAESQLETQLERVRILSNTFNEPEQLAQLRASLEVTLSNYRSVPWWSAGQYELATLYQRSGDLVRAHDLAEQGAKVYPQSLGGQRCLYLQKTIEAPEYSLQGMRLDRPRVRSLAIEHKNLSRVYLRAYKRDFFKDFSAKGWEVLNPYGDWTRDVVHKTKPFKEWTVDLAATPDYKTHRTYVTPPFEGDGFYIVAASARSDFAAESNRITAMPFYLSPLAVVIRTLQSGDQEVFVREGLTGKSAGKVALEIYNIDRSGHGQLVKTLDTDEAGYRNITPAELSQRENHFLTARRGDVYSFDPQAFYLYAQTQTTARSGTLVYTDRSIYRPTQKVFFKIVAFEGDAKKGDYHVVAKQTLRVSFRDANAQEIAFQDVSTNDYGSASGEFVVPTGRLLGAYTIQAVHGSASVRVEEYKRPTFEAEMEPPSKALRLNQKAEVQGHAKYYFGLPVTAGAVKYRVFRQTLLPFWYCWRYFWFSPMPQERQITAGVASLQADGTFRIAFKPEADPNLPDKRGVTFLYRVDADVTDEGGETRTASFSYRIGYVAIEASVTQEKQFALEKEPGALKIFRSDLAGVAKEGAATYQLIRLKSGDKTLWPSEKKKLLSKGDFHLPDDAVAARWDGFVGKEAELFSWADGAEVENGKLKHGADGWAELRLPPLAAGAYRLRYQTRDEYGEAFETQKEFVVAGARSPLKLPIFLYAERPTVKVGEKAVLYFGGGDPGQSLVIDLAKNGKRLRREQWETGKQDHLLTIPITEDLRGGFTAQIFALHDYALVQDQVSVYVPWDNKELQVSFQTFRDRLKPGQEETWTVSVKGPHSEKVAAELLTYMYDRSLDFFTPHHYPTAASLYLSESWYPGVRANLALQSAQVLYWNWYSLPGFPSYGPDYLQFYPNYAIGGPGARGGYRYLSKGMAMNDAAAPRSVSAQAVMEGDAVGGLRAERRDKESGKKLTSKDELGEAKQKSAPGEAQGEVALRSNFSETAFFKAHLVTDAGGRAKIQFKVPDSVTSWNVYVHALTQDLKYMTLLKRAESAKDLMVRPYLPRFLREGDEAILKVVVDNTTTKTLSGEVVLDVVDPSDQKSLLKNFQIDGAKRTFQVEGRKSTTVSYQLKAPVRIGTYAFKVIARAGDVSDGELRPLPILPGRVHLIQSKFAVLKNDQSKVLRIADLAKAASDPTLINDSLVVTLDGQLVYGVLKALPYLVNYPYECLEQTLNRFLSTSIVTSLYDQYPAMKALGREFSKRQTALEPWNQGDANRKMTYEELPWLQVAKGGSSENLINVLDEKIARANRESSLAKIQKEQLGNGAWPWFSGGPPSPYITLYLLQGFAKAAEFKVDIPRDTVQRAWRYLGEHYRDNYKGKFTITDYCYAFITLLNYTLSAYPDASYYDGAFTEADREEMLAYSFSHWKDHNPYGKALLAMTLHRMKRPEDAKLVMASIMDSAKSSENEGTHWAAEDRSWLWYNDTIETHAFILRALLEVEPKNAKLDGLVLWLFLNKKMNQWKSTRATAEVVYSVVTYLKSINALGVREQVDVRLAGQSHQYVFEPATYSGGQNQLVIAGDKVTPQMSDVTVDKKGKGYLFASTTWHYSTEKMPDEERGDFLAVSREYFLRVNEGGRFVLKPLKEGAALKVGDQVEVQLSIRSKHPAEYVHLRDPRAAGLEPERPVSGHHWDLGIVWYEETRDSGANFFFENLPQGEYTFKYRLRANMAGRFKVGPATLQSMYAPEFAAFSAGTTMKVEP